MSLTGEQLQYIIIMIFPPNTPKFCACHLRSNLQRFPLTVNIVGGAALVYTSSKEACNTTSLYKYLIHRLYGFPLRIPPQVVEKDTIFM